VFFSNWLVGSIMGLGVILLLWPLMTWLRDRRRTADTRAVAAPAGAAVVDRER